MKIKKSITVFVSSAEAELIIANEIGRRESENGPYYSNRAINKTDGGFIVECSENEYEEQV